MMQNQIHGLWFLCQRSMRSRGRCAFLTFVLLCTLAVASNGQAQTAPLSQRIDEQIAASHIGPLSPIASDTDFVRRIYLDLTGKIPSAAEARTFMAEASPDKRTKLIDALLATPAHALHMAGVFDVMLMERRPDKHVPAGEWQKYLYESFLARKPYDQLVREILTSDGMEPATRPAAKFVLDREAEPNLLTRDVGRILFGRDLQCAQCHDHPLVDDYYQAEYYGIMAFFGRTQLFTFPEKDKVPAKTVLMDNAVGEVSFQSVFDPSAKGNTLPRATGGKQLEEPRFPLGDEWQVAPAKDARHIPKYSRRAQLAGQVTAHTNRPFNRNIVNRLWAQMMGLGLVEPVDFHHRDNPPTHPQLLEMLADEFVAMKYDTRSFIREIALSQTYQRSLELPDIAPQAAAAGNAIASLEAEHAAIVAKAAASRKTQGELAVSVINARKGLPPIAEELAKALAPAAEIQKAIAASAQAVAETEGQLAPKRDVAATVAAAATKAKEAAAKLPEEKDLAEAATKFQARADQLQAEIAPLAKVVEEKTAAIKVEKEKLVGVDKSQEEILVRLDGLRKQVMAIEDQEEQAAIVSRNDQFQERLVLRRLTEAKAQAQYAASLASYQTAVAGRDKLASDIASSKASAAKLAGELPAQQTAEAAAKVAHEQMQTSMLASKQAAEAKEVARQAFMEVVAAAEAAAQKVPTDTDLAQTAAKLKTRGDQVTAEAAEAQKVFAVQEEGSKIAAAQLANATQVVTTTTTQLAALTQSIPTLESQVTVTEQKIAADQLAIHQVSLEIPDRWSREFATRPLKQLTPEQFGWSILQSTGFYANYVAASRAELEKATPLTDAQKADPAQVALRERQITDDVHTKLAPSVVVFVQLFGAGAGQPQSDFFATVDQALFLANGGVVKGWLAPNGDNLSARLQRIEDPKQFSEELYLTVLTRLPSESEVAEVTKYLAARPMERPQVIQELAWSLLSSAEFRFNH